MLRRCGVATCTAACHRAGIAFANAGLADDVGQAEPGAERQPCPVTVRCALARGCRAARRGCGRLLAALHVGQAGRCRRPAPSRRALRRRGSARPRRVSAAAVAESGQSHHGSCPQLELGRSLAVGIVRAPCRRRLPTAAATSRRSGHSTSGNSVGPTRPGPPLALSSSASTHLVRRDRDLVDPHADGVVDGVGDRRHDRQQRPLPDLLGAERAVRVGVLDQIEMTSGMSSVVGLLYSSIDGNLCTSAPRASRQPAVDLLFHQRLAQAHVDAALDLAADQRRVDRAADVVRDPDPWDGDPAGARSTSTSTTAAE